jgi:succinate dehydrogenase hydrophobic anchor subunit
MKSGHISIWFFIGVLLTVYGALILGYGLFELETGQTANVILADLHAPVWWGALLLALGLFLWHSLSPGPQRLIGNMR